MHSQTEPSIADSLPKLNIQRTDQEPEQVIKDTLNVRFSKDSIDKPVFYQAKDSSDLDLVEETLTLYKEAVIKYDDFEIKADIIVVNFKEGIAQAYGLKDNSEYTGFVFFTDGEQDVTADQIVYNFKTKKFLSYTTRLKENDLYIIAGKSKFVPDNEGKSGIFYFKNGIFTTCNAEKAHYGIRSNKQKIIPDKVAVVGVSNVEISEVPTPLVLPFGFFPLARKATKGVIFPNDYEYSDLWGFGLRGIGYYIPINDYMDATVRGDIYLRGSFAIGLENNYKKRYKYTGRAEIAYSYRTQENFRTGLWEPQRSININWSHNQDPNAHPFQTFGGTLRFQTNNFQNLNYNDVNSVFTNTMNSNISYQRRFPGKPFNISVALNHSQNTQTRVIDVSFPNFDFQMQRLFPFKKRKSGIVGKPKWYEDISITYNNSFRNTFRGLDTTFFTRQTLDSARMGWQHNANFTSNFRIFKYINAVPNIQYRETWHIRTINKRFDPELSLNPKDTIINPNTQDTLILFDTIAGRLIREQVSGFRAWRTIESSMNFNTQLFGTALFKKGFLRGLRHVLKPAISFSYSPSYIRPELDYFREVQRSLNNLDKEFYSIFEESIFGSPPRQDQRFNISYSLNNIFEGKVRFKGDSIDRKFKLMDNIIISGNYSSSLDSFNWSRVNVRGTHRMFKNMTTITLGLTLDPYALDAEGRRINVLLWNQKKQLLRFQDFNFQVNTTLDFRTLRSWFEGNNTPTPSDGLNSLWDLIESFSINHALFAGVAVINGQNQFMIGTNNVNLTGSMQLTPKWRINFGNIGYDFNRKALTYPDIGFYRDLHCWETGMDWQPQRGTYNFYIRVKPSSLDFLKVPYRKNNVDGLQRL